MISWWLNFIFSPKLTKPSFNNSGFKLLSKNGVNMDDDHYRYIWCSSEVPMTKKWGKAFSTCLDGANPTDVNPRFLSSKELGQSFGIAELNVSFWLNPQD